MRLRVVDYVANDGGGVRFAVELLDGLVRSGVDVEVVSHGGALARYRAALAGREGVRFADVPPENKEWQGRRKQTWPVVGPVWRALGIYGRFHYRVPARALERCDVAWFPWVHRHRLPAGGAVRVLGSLHDLIMLEFRAMFPAYIVADEAATLRRWFRSSARVVVSSEATAATLARLLGVGRERLDLVSLAGKHAAAQEAPPEALPAVAAGPFLLCPANTSPHKNHEVLLDGFGRWGARWPLVLTGGGTDVERETPRAREVRARIAANGLVLGTQVHGLGYLDDPTYYALLRRARALVMPTLAEGGGSFPVWEALFEGVPVVCSDIPVLREMMARVGGEVLWFDPRDPESLAARLRELEAAYPDLVARARAQIPRLVHRSWDDIAAEYGRIAAAAAGYKDAPWR